MKATGFITAGGRSSRMGRDKAWLDLGGVTMIERIIAQLAPAVSSLALISSHEEAKRLGLPVFRDQNAGIGPLEAIRTALANSPTHLIVLVGCDLPFVTTELFTFLLSRAEGQAAVVPVGPDGRLQPLCAVYSTDALEQVSDLILSGERKVSLLLDRIKTRVIGFDDLMGLSDAVFFFENVNTPQEYARALGRFATKLDTT